MFNHLSISRASLIQSTRFKFIYPRFILILSSLVHLEFCAFLVCPIRSAYPAHIIFGDFIIIIFDGVHIIGTCAVFYSLLSLRLPWVVILPLFYSPVKYLVIFQRNEDFDVCTGIMMPFSKERTKNSAIC